MKGDIGILSLARSAGHAFTSSAFGMDGHKIMASKWNGSSEGFSCLLQRKVRLMVSLLHIYLQVCYFLLVVVMPARKISVHGT